MSEDKKQKIRDKISDIHYSDLSCVEKQEQIRELERELELNTFEEI